ncbi:hypothetical protein [Bartonella phoceensis]|nr:hypothetical protein [Bartonella phoceensis]
MNDLQNAVFLAHAFVKGGLKTIAITLRTANTYNAMKAIT